MNALALPALFFLQSLLGFICFPLGMIYADQPRPLDQVIAHLQSVYHLPTPYVLFLGDPAYATPMASTIDLQTPDFDGQIRDQLRLHSGRYGLVIIQGGTDYPVQLSRILQWGNSLLKIGGWVLLWNPREDRYEMAFKRE